MVGLRRLRRGRSAKSCSTPVGVPGGDGATGRAGGSADARMVGAGARPLRLAARGGCRRSPLKLLVAIAGERKEKGSLVQLREGKFELVRVCVGGAGPGPMRAPWLQRGLGLWGPQGHSDTQG